MIKRILIFLLTLGLIPVSWTQTPDDSSRHSVEQPCENMETLRFTVRKGTWMNLDLSPDGKTIVFDLLGDIYTMPVSGGNAKVLRSGPAWEVQPRFSPDGKYIAFTSDAGGGDNIWIMQTDGNNARQLTQENFRLLNNPVWSPDGQYIAARKHFTGTRSAGAGEIWMYHVLGGDGIRITQRKNDQQDVNEPFFSPDGKYIYFSEDMYPGGYFQYNKDPNNEIYITRRYNFETGKIENLIRGSGGAMRPTPSPDGKKLAFIRRIRNRTVLFIHDLQTGNSRPLYDELDKDQQETWALFGTFPGFAWSPDMHFIYIWSKGQILKINTQSGEAQPIPMEVDVQISVCPTLRFQQGKIEDTFLAKAIRHTRTSPDGSAVVAHAAGHLYIRENKGEFRRLCNDAHLEFEPTFSPDGKYISYVTWDDVDGGAIYRFEWKKKGARPEKITSERGIYRSPAFSPDGSEIVYVREKGNEHLGTAVGTEFGIFRMPLNTRKPIKISEEGDFPQYFPDGKRIGFQTGGHLFGSLDKQWVSVNLDGHDKQVHAKSKYANLFLPSPDGKWLAFTELYKVYIVPFPKTGQTLDLSGNMKSLPVACVSDNAGIALQWTRNGTALQWTLGPVRYETLLRKHFAGPETTSVTDTITEIIFRDTLNINLSSAIPGTTIAFTGARILTMDTQGIIENGTLVVQNNRIAAVGPTGSITVPENAIIIDLKGKTILPGYVDVHAHTGNFRHGISPQQQWEYMANLAFGVTTTHDPSANTEMVFAQSEAIRTGAMFGPRLFSTGTILYGADGDFKAVIDSPEDALRAIQRNKAFGAFSVKSYNQPRRNQRQQIIEAARKEQMLVVPEGGSHFYHNMSMIVDGHTGIEHNIPIAPLYDDVIEFWRRTQSGNTPTLIVNYGSLQGEYYWYQHTNVWEDSLLLRYVPREVVDARSRHRTMAPESDYESGHILTSKSCKVLHDAGVSIQLGSHGQMQGVGAHWEIWMLTQGGMSPLEALQAATLNGAKYLGLVNDLGSIAPGKLADLQILNQNPLEDIRHTREIAMIMLNGRLYRIPDLQEVHTGDFKPKPMHWQLNNGQAPLPWSQLLRGCSCGKH